MLMNSGVRFFIVAFAVIILLIFGIVLINRNGSGTTNTIGGINLAELANEPGTAAQSYIEGPIVAASQHSAIRMTVNARTAKIEVISGYENNVVNSKTYDNNQEAFTQFLDALGRAGYTKERRMSNPNADAVCPTGNRTHYRVLTTDAEQRQNSWTASCTSGTFGGNVGLTSRLFRAQFPDYNQITSGLNLNNSQPSTGLVL